MLPKNAYDITEEKRGERQPDATYRLSASSLGGLIGGIDAVAQAAYRIIGTERYRYPIYSSDYGIELAGLFGKDGDYVKAELERRIKEALTADDRVADVRDFEFTFEKNKIGVTFVMNTVFGEIQSGKEFIYG